ncbi:MAG: hypothetical protein JWO14_3772, partial [Solirubrobacterales bacterium]|nr:hypothetical protein [Solirubrobacterales bacterium]
MGGDGVTKVVSRKLPRDRTEDEADESDGPETLTAVA